MSKDSSGYDPDSAPQIVAFFSILIGAWQKNDFSEAARAQTELKQLGVNVTMPRKRQQRKGGSDES